MRHFTAALTLVTLMVVALADPPPRTGLVERALIAAYAGGLYPILCLTKTDLAPPEPFAANFADLDLTITTAGRDDPLDAVAPLLKDKVTVLLGHSGVGKSTLVNRLVPDADRATGEVTACTGGGESRDRRTPQKTRVQKARVSRSWLWARRRLVRSPCR